MKNIISQTATSVQLYGSPRQNRLHLNGNAGAKIAQGDFITITADGISDIYEFRDSTPPLGGTNGRIWVYNGANAAASRSNLASAIFGGVDATLITRTAQDPTAGTNRVKVITLGGSPAVHAINVIEWTTAGFVAGSTFELNPTVVALTATENLTELGDVWDQAAFYNGTRTGTLQVSTHAVALTAPMIASGGAEIVPHFANAAIGFVQNRSRAQTEITLHEVGSSKLQLAGGGSPKNQPTDIINALFFGA